MHSAGFEPANQKGHDLKSCEFNHSSNHAYHIW